MAQKISVASDKPRRGFKEFIRKFIVGLKRNPQNIAMFVMLATFLVYSLNLTIIARTTEKIGLVNMGQCEFVSMLLGILAFVSYLRAYPRREKPKLVMIILTLLMLVASIFSDVIYKMRINEGLTRTDPAPVVINDETWFIPQTDSLLTIHIILLAVSVGLIVLLPIYSKLLRKINTSIDVAGNENMEVIDISGED